MKFLYYLSFFLLLFSCSDVKRPEKPKDLISEEKMVSIYTETYLTNAARSVDSRFIRENGIKLDSFIYSKFGIDSLQFVKSNTYYASDMDTYESIFLKVEKNLAALKIEKDSIVEVIDKEEGITKEKKDSVVNAEEGLLIESQTSEEEDN
ncbi:DUF4296 domain-containing protein [Patiriisocius hiemis]|uniref:DUF4296 domain-containing protein n=1 Tax=Patiriisocius hiemis TaxID=3075604 RepID=A0ABU2YEU6_9FLAO|nr:DUF4296 domain-containing protein [Constantimarinum sp. W242]MDT0556391.1 DUF4296 domain-containing protein [Constantimarinum sp. W242]